MNEFLARIGKYRLNSEHPRARSQYGGGSVREIEFESNCQDKLRDGLDRQEKMLIFRMFACRYLIIERPYARDTQCIALCYRSTVIVSP